VEETKVIAVKSENGYKHFILPTLGVLGTALVVPEEEK